MVQLGIREKISLVLLAVVVAALLITGGLFYHHTQQTLRAGVEQHLLTTSNIQRKRVQQVIDLNRERMALLSSRTQLRLSLRDYLATGRAAHLAKLQRIITDAKSSLFQIQDILLTTTDGRVLAATSEAWLDLPQSEVAALNLAELEHAHFALRRHNGLVVSLRLTSALRVEEAVIAAMVVLVDLTSLWQITEYLSGVGITEETVLSHRLPDGRSEAIVPLRHGRDYRDRAMRIDPFATDSFANDSLASDSFVITGQETGTQMREAVDYRGQRVFAISSRFDDVNWGLTVKVDRAEALAALEEQRDFLLLILLGATIVAIAVSILLARSITQPIVSLSRAAVSIAGGDFKQRIHHHSRDELGMLALSINQMADRLIEANTSLEQRVREKTQELERLNKRLESTNVELEEQSRIDALTGVCNRRSFDEELVREWRRCCRAAKPLAVLVIDIDFFKAYNDAHGHAGGDKVLRAVAQALARCARRPGDMVARYGGEEFAALLPDTDESRAMVVAREMQRAVQMLGITHPGSTVSSVISVSMGIASRVPSRDTVPQPLIEAADAALYRAKANGRNCIESAGAHAKLNIVKS